MDARTRTGSLGEREAERAYVRRGYRVLARNWRCSVGELDLVLRRGDTLVVCEVKTRRGTRFGGGFEAVDARKRAKLGALAEVFVLQHDLTGVAVRFDVASVSLRPEGTASVQLFDDAF